MKSIYSKLVVGFLLSIVFSFSVAGYFTLRNNANELSSLTYDELDNSCDYVMNLIKMSSGDELETLLDGYANTSEISFQVEMDNDSYTCGMMNDELNLTSEEKVILSKEGESVHKTRASIRQMSKSYEMDGSYYVVTIQKDATPRESVFMSSAVIAVFCILISGSVMFFVLADIIVKPISRLTKATEELSKGNYRVRVNYSGNDEIAALNRSFNQMAQQLAKSEETRQQFISDVTHEFQTPLTAIEGFATILKNETLPDEQRKKYADIILFHSKRLSSLAKNMLQLTMLDNEDLELDKTEFSLIEQLLRVISTQESQAISKDIEIEFNRPKNDIVIEADEARLEQVWLNLLSNAIKYTGEHGVVTIEVKRTSKEVEVSFADTGQGMSQEAISHIFERFYRDDKSRNIEGNGLGLSIVKRIVDLHEGVIDVESQEDAGSVFTVRLPYERKILGKLNNLGK